MVELYRSDICNVDINKSLLRTYAGIVLSTGDKLANRFGANVYRQGDPVDLTACAVTGYFIRPNRETVVIPGAVEGNTAYVDLPQACYTASGSFSLAIKISSTEITQTIRVIDGCIRLSQTDALIDPGEAVPSLDELFAVIADTKEATNEAYAVIEDMKGAASAIIDTKEGMIACASDAAARPAVEVVSGIDVTAAGVSAVNLYRTGKNLLRLAPDSIKKGSVQLTVDDAGVLTADGISTLSSSATVALESVYLPAGTYTLSYKEVSGSLDSMQDAATLLYANVNGTFHRTRRNTASITFTLSAAQTVTIGFMVTANGATYNGYTMHCQLETGNAATDYEQGNMQTLAAELPATVYGGSLDWLNGVLTVTHDADGNAVDPYDVEITKQQLELLEGVNNVWSDCGETKLVYVADTKLYIDNKFTELQNAILAQGANI